MFDDQLTSEATRNSLALSERMTGRPHPASAPGSRSLIAMSRFGRHIPLQSSLLLSRAFSRLASSSLSEPNWEIACRSWRVAASWTKAVKQMGLASA
jgi:hypothetical protein